MPSDAEQADETRDPMDGVAAIPPVTGEMMDHAAREAAALADGVAHHEIETERPAAEAVDAPETTTAEAADAFRATTDEAADGARETVAAAGELSEAARDGLSASADALGRYNAKVFEMVRANMASTTALFAALVQAKSVPEALSINADHLRRQMETLTSQGRELATLAQTIALDALQPLKGRSEG